jgi:D-alanine-D-alanine ligase
VPESPIAIVHNKPIGPTGDFSEASCDVLDQVNAVEQSLVTLGHRTIRVPFTRDVGAFVKIVQKTNIRYAFNLTETVDEDPGLVGHPAAVMDLLGISYTGSTAWTLATTTDKILTKHVLMAQKIATPHYEGYDGAVPMGVMGLRFPVIVKPRCQDASIGIDQESVFLDQRGLMEALPRLCEQLGPLIVEEFIAGREFNISVFGYPRARVLPIAEIRFDDFPGELHPIVGYRAKWEKNSFEYNHTPRIFPKDLSEALSTEIQDTAIRCFRAFELRDYGRVDIRVDVDGHVYVLEVNANPCISPDAGFPASLAEGGISFDRFVRGLLGFAEERDRPMAPSYHGAKLNKRTSSNSNRRR